MRERENISIQVEEWKKYQPSWPWATDVTWRSRDSGQGPHGVWNGRARRNDRTGKCWRKLQKGWKKRLGCNYVGSLVSCKEFRQRLRGISEDSLSIQQGVWARRLGPALWTRVQGRVVGLLKIPFTQVQWITEERWDKVLTVRGRHWEEQQEYGGAVF